MTRSGPNQDINDPTTLIDLAYRYQQQSDQAGNLLAQSNAQNPNVNGSPIINISIPFRKSDGSIQLLYGEDIEFDTQYIYDNSLVSNANINTYIYLAERFRDYWEILNNVLNQLNDYDYVIEDNIDPEGPTIAHLYGGQIRTHGSLGGITYRKKSYSHLPSESLSIPVWNGIGPTNYNQLTYPQLLNELQKINIQISVSEIIWNTVYWYDKLLDASGDSRGAWTRFGKHEQYGPPFNQQYVQIYNNESNTIEISLSIDISATLDKRFTVSYASWAEIDDVNSYPNPFGGWKHLLSSYISYSEEKLSPGGTIVLSTNRIIEIPPGKSAFIGCHAGAGTTFGNAISVGEVSITLVLNDQTLTYLVSLT